MKYARNLPLVATIVLIAAVTSLTMLTMVEGCGAVKPVTTDIIDCAKAETATVKAGLSIVQVAMEVIAVLEGGPSNVLTAIEDLAKKYGGDIVACAVDNYPEPGSGSGSSSSASQAVLNKHMAMSTLFGAKKLSHTFRGHQ